MTRALFWRLLLCFITAFAFELVGVVVYTLHTGTFSLLELVDAAVMSATVGWLGAWVFIRIVAGPLHRRPSPRTEPVPAVVDDWLTVAHAAGVAR